MTVRAPAAETVRFFASAAHFRRWLQRSGERAPELWVGFHAQASGRGGMSYTEAVEETLCYGWIDGVRHKLDIDSYANRFSPRRPGRCWSALNLRRFAALRAQGRVAAPGLRAFEARDTAASGFAITDRPLAFDSAVEAAWRADARAWTYFAAQPPAYRHDAAWWVTSAQREATRVRRLATLVADSAAGRRVGPYAAAQQHRASAPHARTGAR